MKVKLVAQTTIHYDALAEMGYISHYDDPQTPEPPEYTIPDDRVDDETYFQFNPEWGEWHDTNIPREMDELAEAAGRLCYKSFSRPNEKTATNAGYIANILDHKHFSVLEHSSVTFWISGVSRSLTHELVRHRHLSFSQVSQRYVDESEAEVVIPPGIAEDDHATSSMILRSAEEARDVYRHLVIGLTNDGLSRKEARQAARSVLPNATATEILVTGNLRTWREVIDKRNSAHADAEIQLLAEELLRQLKTVAPNTFQDM